MSEPDKSGPPIKAELADRKNRWNINIQAWMEGQGRKIRGARPEPVYAACLFMAMGRCRRRDWQYLADGQIKECEMRALSQGRVKMFGPKLPPTNEAWDEQIEQVRASWATPKQEAA